MESIKTELFIHSNEEIPDSFIRFADIRPVVDRCTAIPGVKIYFKTSGQIVKICQPIEQETNIDINSFAHFYPNYEFNKPLHDLLSDEASSENFKLFPTFKNLYNENRFELFVNIYIRKQYLIELYDSDFIPNIIRQLFNTYNRKLIKIKLNTAINSQTCNSITEDKYKIQPMIHQKNNVEWLKFTENKVDTGLLTFSTNDTSVSYINFYIESINDYIICELGTYKFIKPETLPKIDYKFKGGVICDTIGLGKTLTFISLIVESNLENPSIIFCPKRICKQWESEIHKFTDLLKVKIIGNITQYKKLTTDNVKNFNVNIVPYNLFESKKYLELRENTEYNCIFETYLWERVILDESHEYIGVFNKKNIEKITNFLFNVKSKYRWLCSGTPFTNIMQFDSIISYLCNEKTSYSSRNKKISQNIINYTVDNIFRLNNKESTSNYIDIPEPEINTEFLDQTPIERMIYDSALDDQDKMIQLCNHIQVSEHHINILGNEPMTLEDIQVKMTEFLQKQIDKYSKRIKRCQEILENDEENIQTLELLTDYTDKLKSSKFKLEIFTNIEEKLDENESCPICLEEFDDLTKVITPCGHFVCGCCVTKLFSDNNNRDSFQKCPMCRHIFYKEELTVFKNDNPIQVDDINKWGTKMARLISYVNEVLSTPGDRIIIFSQWDNMLKLVSKVLTESSISHITINGSMYTINNKIRKFKLDESIKVALLSSEKSSSGLNLTEANHIILLDTLNTDKNTARVIEEQAIGRSVRIGQQKTVKVQRFIMRNTIEHDFYNQIYN